VNLDWPGFHQFYPSTCSGIKPLRRTGTGFNVSRTPLMSANRQCQNTEGNSALTKPWKITHWSYSFFIHYHRLLLQGAVLPLRKLPNASTYRVSVSNNPVSRPLSVRKMILKLICYTIHTHILSALFLLLYRGFCLVAQKRSFEDNWKSLQATHPHCHESTEGTS